MNQSGVLAWNVGKESWSVFLERTLFDGAHYVIYI